MAGSNSLDSFCAEKLSEVDEVVLRFADYQPRRVDRPSFLAWLGQFRRQHWELALRFAGAIRYYSTAEIHQLVPSWISFLEQQLPLVNCEFQDVIFVPVGKLGDSGHHMARALKKSVGPPGLRNSLVDVSQLTEAIVRAKNPVVAFFDDFIGTGKQFTDWWRDVASQIVPDFYPCFYLVVAAFNESITLVEAETPVRVLAVHTLTGQQQLSAGTNTLFSKAEKQTLGKYCAEFGNEPLGFGEVQALVSFSHGTPNNCVSIIRGSNGQKPKRGLLPGWDDLRDG